MSHFPDFSNEMSASPSDSHDSPASSMASSLKSILRKPSVDDNVPAAHAQAPRKTSVSFEDVLARDAAGHAVPPSTRSRDEWILEVNARRGASLIDKFRGDAETCRVTLVEDVDGEDVFAGEVIVFEASSDSDEETDEDTDVESDSESGSEEGETVEVVFENDDDDEGGDGEDDGDGDDEKKEKDEEKKEDEPKDEPKGEKDDSMEYARSFLQSEIGRRYPMCQRAVVY